MHKFGDEPSHAQVRYGCSLLKIINLIVMDLERPWFLEFNQENIEKLLINKLIEKNLIKPIYLS